MSVVCFVLVSWGYCNKSVQTWQLKSAEIYSLTVLEARSPKSRCWQGRFLLESLRENLSCASSTAGGGVLQFGVIIPGSASVSTQPSSLCVSSVYLKSPLPSHIRRLVTGHPKSKLILQYLITSVEILFPNKVRYSK